MSVVERAWNETKPKGDVDWSDIKNREFKEKLQFAVDRAIATGTGETDFELAVLKFYKEGLEKQKKISDLLKEK